MRAFRTPLQGGYIYNNKLNGPGILFNNQTFIIKTGNFYNDKLNGDDCIYVNYNGTEYDTNKISIVCGTFINDKKDGQITFYTFKKSQWTKFLLQSIIAEKETYLYTNGACVSLQNSTTNVYISGTCTFDKIHNLIVAFNFTETYTFYSKVKKYFFTRSNN